MSQYEKQLERVKNLDKNLRFDELKTVLERIGYEMRGPSGGSSHMTFRKAGCPPITIPTHEPVKKVYIAMVKELLEREEYDEEES